MGLIPAHAGKTLARPRRLYACRAHPRSRGENESRAARTWSTYGSSPLTRGKLRAGGDLDGPAGLIPAHAGKTTSGGNDRTYSWAHPRSRGENADESRRSVIPKGSSPLTRGKHEEPLRGASRAGLIPAHAGKTPILRRGVFAPGAHPRSRGENGMTPAGTGVPAGSSPLTRGKHEVAGAGEAVGGLIPAHAGKTVIRRPQTRSGRAHPRSRGENSNQHSASNHAEGSSPLTRGKLRPVPGG